MHSPTAPCSAVAASLLFRFRAATLGHNPGRRGNVRDKAPGLKALRLHKTGEEPKILLRAVGDRLDRREFPAVLGGRCRNARCFHIHGQGAKARRRLLLQESLPPLDPG